MTANASHPKIVVTAEMDAVRATGVQTHFTDFMEYLRDHGREVEFVGRIEAIHRHLVRRIAVGLLNRLVPIHPQLFGFALRRLSFHATRSELRRVMRGLSVWNVYAQDPVTALAAVSLRRGRGQRVTLAIHYNVSQAEEMANRSLIPRDGWLYKRMQREERQAIRGSDNVVSCSQFMRSNLERHDPGGGRILVIPNTAKVPIPASDAVERDLIAVGTLEPRKNQQFLLRVLAEARRRGYRYTISIVGSGEDAERLQSLSKELGIADQAFFLGRKNAAPLLSAHKVLVHGALIENLPIALIEALAAGVPILAPAVGGIPEVFDEGVEGRFWNLNDVEASASILIETMEDTAGLAAMSRAARTRYRETFDREVVFEKLTEVIDG